MIAKERRRSKSIKSHEPHNENQLDKQLSSLHQIDNVEEKEKENNEAPVEFSVIEKRDRLEKSRRQTNEKEIEQRKKPRGKK